MKIYVVTHKKVDYALPENYVYMQAGAAVNGVIYPQNDAVGEDNISAKNPYYCELTAAYWIMKNDRENDIVGLVHYRRYLSAQVLSRSPKHYLNSPRIERDLATYDFIAPKPHKCHGETQKENLLGPVREKDFDILRDVISTSYPEYLADFDAVFASDRGYLLNMFICKKTTWDAYYTWLFSVLSAVEARVDMTGYSTQEKRLYGYLSERLFSVYVRKNGCRVKHYSVILKEDHIFHRVKEKVKQVLHIGN